jgi:hypothetical protein
MARQKQTQVFAPRNSNPSVIVKETKIEHHAQESI